MDSKGWVLGERGGVCRVALCMWSKYLCDRLPIPWRGSGKGHSLRTKGTPRIQTDGCGPGPSLALVPVRSSPWSRHWCGLSRHSSPTTSSARERRARPRREKRTRQHPGCSSCEYRSDCRCLGGFRCRCWWEW